MAGWWDRARDYFGGSDPGDGNGNDGYWSDPKLESIFDQVDPAVRYGFDEEFTPADESRGRALFYEGFVSERISPDDRQEARESFLDWMTEFDIDTEDFPWDDWREWYSEG